MLNLKLYERGVYLALFAMFCTHGCDSAPVHQNVPQEIVGVEESVAKTEKPGPLVVIGLDAASFDVIDPLVAAGKLPNLAALMKAGAHGVLTSERPMRSPALWTTIATGKSRDEHDIYDFVTGSEYWPKARQDDNQRLVTSDMRKSRAIWELAAQANKKSLVVGWLNTWPAEKIDGLMVAPYVALGHRKQTSIKGKIYADAAQQSYPQDAWSWVQPLIVSADDVPAEELARIVQSPQASSPLFSEVPRLKRYLYTAKWSVAGARSNFNIVREAMRREPYDVVMTFIDGSDTLAHRFWLFRESLPAIRRRLRHYNIDPKHAEALKAHFGETVSNFYRYADKLIGDLVKELPENANILVLSDHGFGDFDSAKAVHETTPFDGQHLLEGILIAKGPSFSAGRRKDPASHYDITPTMLQLLGLKTPPSMVGQSLSHWMDRPPLAKIDVKNGKRGATSRAKTSKTPFEAQELERLKSLGYVQ